MLSKEFFQFIVEIRLISGGKEYPPNLKKNKLEKLENTERKKTEREFNIVMSGQFRILAVFMDNLEIFLTRISTRQS